MGGRELPAEVSPLPLFPGGLWPGADTLSCLLVPRAACPGLEHLLPALGKDHW